MLPPFQWNRLKWRSFHRKEYYPRVFEPNCPAGHRDLVLRHKLLGGWVHIKSKLLMLGKHFRPMVTFRTHPSHSFQHQMTTKWSFRAGLKMWSFETHLLKKRCWLKFIVSSPPFTSFSSPYLLPLSFPRHLVWQPCVHRLLTQYHLHVQRTLQSSYSYSRLHFIFFSSFRKEDDFKGKKKGGINFQVFCSDSNFPSLPVPPFPEYGSFIPLRGALHFINMMQKTDSWKHSNEIVKYVPGNRIFLYPLQHETVLVSVDWKEGSNFLSRVSYDAHKPIINLTADTKRCILFTHVQEHEYVCCISTDAQSHPTPLLLRITGYSIFLQR